jgi:PAS domain S-box-containing protein
MAGILFLTAIYFAAAKLGLSLAFAAEQVSPVWPPTGIALAAVLLFGYRVWPGIALGAFLANVTASEPLATALGIAVGNTMEALLGAWLLHQFVGFQNSLSRIKDVVGLIVLAGGIATTVSASLGVLSLCLGRVNLPSLQRTIEWSDFGSLWWIWWLGDAMGALVVTPVLLIWATDRGRWSPRQLGEVGLLLIGLVATSLIAFAGGLTTSLGHSSLAYAIFPFVIWAALRFGQRGSTIVTLVASTLAIWATVRGLGPYGGGDVHERLLLLQVFLGVVAATALILGAALAEQRRAERELHLIADSVPVPLTYIDAEQRYQFVNKAYEATSGVPAEQALGRHVREVLGEAVYESIRPHMERALAGERVEYQAEVPYATGLRWVRPTYVPDVEGGQIRGYFAAIPDITEHKRAEELLLEADRRKDEFLATLAHELRNPLAPIRTSLEVFGLSANLSPADQRLRQVIERQVNHLVRLVDDLLDVSRISRGKIELRKQPVELAAIIECAVEASRPLFEAAGHKLIVNLPSQRLVLLADAVRLSQVIGNLLNNAAKYTDAGGQVWLSAQRQDDSVVISVHDTGVGISTEMLPRVFDMFTQLQPVAGRCQEGLGIGLTLVKRLTEMHGGVVEAYSAGAGKGSEFIVRIPLAQTTHAIVTTPRQGDQVNATPGWPDRVLVVDDNRDAADSLAVLLKSLGIKVQVAYDGSQALLSLRDLRPNVVLLDIGMPGMDGYEVARRIREQADLRHIGLIALTGWGQEEDRRRSAASGFNHHLLKPVDFQILCSLLASLAVEEHCASGVTTNVRESATAE